MAGKPPLSDSGLSERWDVDWQRHVQGLEQRGAVRPLTDNSLSETSASEEEQVENTDNTAA